MKNLFLLLILFSTLTLKAAPKQKDVPKNNEAKLEIFTEEEQFEQILTERLKRIRRDILKHENELYEKRRALRSENDLVIRGQLETSISDLKQLTNDLYLKFIETATKEDLTYKQKEKNNTHDLWDDVKDILSPLFKGLREIGERPRAIQRLQEELNETDKKLTQAKNAQKKLINYPLGKDEKILKSTLKRAEKRSAAIVKELEIKSDDLQFRMHQLEQEKGPVVEEVTKLLFGFLSTKGKNLLLAMITFVTIFFGLRKGRGPLIQFIMQRLMATGRYSSEPWVIRPFKVIYNVFTSIISLFMGLMTLYILNDWVLVTLILFLITAVIWSLRQYFPLFLEQIKIVLNLGTVREGERVVFQGIPWKIKRVGYFCRLVNPALSGGDLRVNAKALMNSHSRPINEKESWFPTTTNDWIELADQRLARVIRQSPDQVVIKFIGGHTQSFKADDFYTYSFSNLSDGFGIEIIFGLDYNLQQIILSEVINNLKEHIVNRLNSDFCENELNQIKEVQVDFHSATAHSLDLRIFLVCAGDIAAKKYVLKRKLQSYCVEACNQYHYNIPFEQLTVHLPQGMS